jgi:hypothetical protein
MRDRHLHWQRHTAMDRDGHRHGHLCGRRRAWWVLLLVLHHQRVGCVKSAKSRRMTGISVRRDGTGPRGRSALTMGMIMARLIGCRRHIG